MFTQYEEKRMINPKGSQAFGLGASAVTGLAVFTAIWGCFVWKLNFWHLHEIFGPALGFIGACLSAYVMFMSGQGETIDLYFKGIGLFLGKPNGKVYANGKHWFCPVLSGAR